jgi:preprotein translocase subunit SecA
VVPIPTNQPMIREDKPDVVYKTEASKFDAVVEDIAERFESGQPVLVGTTSVQKSEYLSQLLTKRGVKHEVLNAKQHDREAIIVAQAGRLKAVTVATNMAGRGTDIMLGGNPEFLADHELRQRGLSPVDTPEEYESAWTDELDHKRKEVEAEHEEVVELGGLYVLGTERHESRRIDNQLRGRSGRQGDPGESRFYLSLGDDLMRLFNAAAVESIMNRLQIPDDVPIESKLVTRAIRSAQTQVEQQNFEIRKNVLKYDEVLNKQRMVIYDERRRVLEGEDLSEQARHFLTDTVTGYVSAATGEGYPEEWDLDQLWTALGTLYPVGVEVPASGSREGLTGEGLIEDLNDDALEAYDRREASLGEAPDGTPVLRELERRVVLSVLDRKWREHLYEMDYLQEGIGLRAMGQRDPLVEYQREGFDMFSAMMEAIKEESVGFLFNVEVQMVEEPSGEVDVDPVAPISVENWVSDEESAAAAPEAPAAPASQPASRAPLAKGFEGGSRPQALTYTSPTVDGDGAVVSAKGGTDLEGGVIDATGGKPGRNDPCPCGSGRKYKRCHGDPARRSSG